MKKQLIVWIAVLCLILPMVSGTASAVEVVDSGTCGENLTWTLSDQGVLTVSGTGPMAELSGVQYPWYDHRGSITSVVIENGVTSIGSYAFESYQNLISATLPDSIVTIGKSSFYYCKKLESLELGTRLEAIGSLAFGSCYALKYIEIPESVFSIKKDAFEYCAGLIAFSVDPENACFSNDDAGVLFDKDQTTLIQAPGSISGDYSVPDSVMTINSNAFSNCDQLIDVTIGTHVRKIGERAFDGCDALETVSVSASVTEIGDHAFSDCNSLLRFIVDSANSRYSNDEYGVLFDKTQTTLIQAPGAISGVYSIPDTATSIGNYAFHDCNELTGILGGENVSTIGWAAFEYCDNLYSVTLADSVTDMDYYAFAWCKNLTSIQLGMGLTEISPYTFYDCKSLNDIILPVGIRKIGYGAFRGCSSLEEMVIPSNVTLIDEWALSSCKRLKSVYFLGDAPEIFDTSFIDTEFTAYYPKDNSTWTDRLLRDYGGTITWIPYPTTAEIASGWSGNTQWSLTDDGVLTFSGTGNMKNYDYNEGQPWIGYADQITAVVIEEGINAVGSCAFKGLTRLERVALPESGLSKIGEAAFYGCASLKEIHIPDGLYTIHDYTFKNCSGLDSVRLPRSLIKIGQGAFENCASLDDVFIPGDTEIIGAWSFKGCAGLTEADMQWADATEIREGAFKNCSALTKIILPADIQVLGDSCFYGIGAKSFTVPETVTSVAPWCFARAYSLTEIIFEGDAPAIGEGAFNRITLTAYYPGDNATWTASVMQNYGGYISWELISNETS